MKQNKIKNIVSVAIGAALGTSLRYYMNVYTLTSDYPIGTVIENVSGSFLLGLLSGWFVYKLPQEWVKVGLMTGLCGGFTTMSTFASDSIGFILNGNWLFAMIYILVSIFGGIAFAYSGYIIGQKVGMKRHIRKETIQ